jgi:hypothetical protein
MVRDGIRMAKSVKARTRFLIRSMPNRWYISEKVFSRETTVFLFFATGAVNE